VSLSIVWIYVFFLFIYFFYYFFVLSVRGPCVSLIKWSGKNSCSRVILKVLDYMKVTFVWWKFARSKWN